MKIQTPFIILVLLFGGLNLTAQSNEGTEFWFGFMEHRDIMQNTKVAMITSKINTTGTISVPTRNWSETFSIIANEVTIIELPQFTETVGSEFIENNAIHITSQSPVSVYAHQYFEMRSEATVVLPVESLGREYFVLTYTGSFIRGVDYPSEFLVVATKDNTTVKIQLSANTQGGRPAGSSFEILLNQGEVYQVKSASWNGDLTGSFVQADKKITVFAGATWAQVPAGCTTMDNLFEQMYPVQSLGDKFVTVPNANLSRDQYRILATEDNTMVNVESQTNTTYVINRGKHVEFSLSQPAFIKSNKPVMVAQYMIGSDCIGYGLGDPSMVMLNSVNQVRDTVTLFNSRFQNITENHISIICKTEDTNKVEFDGNNLVASGQVFTKVGTGGEFSFIVLDVSTGAHTIISEGCGVIANAYGYGFIESYAYSGGASFSSINRNPLPEGGCLNDTVFFDAQLDPDRYSFFWDLGDEIRTEPKFTKIYDALGSFPASVIVTDECLNEADTFYSDMLISIQQSVTAGDDVQICENESFELTVSDLTGATYEWVGPNDYFSEDQFPIIPRGKPAMNGVYSVVGIVSGCATAPDSATVEIINLPEPDLGNDTTICLKDDIDLILAPGDFVSYLWQDNSTSSTYFLSQPEIVHVQVFDDFGCVGVDSILIKEQCPTVIFLPNVFTPNNDNRNDAFGVLGNDIITMQLIIYDRWGGLIFESSNQIDQWNGDTNGGPANEGVYVWKLTFTGFGDDGITFMDSRTGSVTLLR